MRIIVITREVPNKIKSFFPLNENDYVIAVDGAFDSVIKQKITPNLVVGDMDSVKNKKALKRFEQIKLKKEKDETDTFVAVKHAYTLSNNVILIGGIKGDRIEHFIANLYLFNSFPNLQIIDDVNNIYLLKEGKHIITKSKYTSIFAKEESIITLQGFKYELNNYKLIQYNPLGISNEIIKVYGEIIVHSGSIYVIESN